LVDPTVIVDVPLLPWVTPIVPGIPLIVKSGVTMIVNVKDCEWLRLPLVPVIVILADDAGVPGSMLTVATDVTDPPGGGVTGFDENEACTPDGNDPAFRFTAELNVPTEAIVTVSVAELPDPTVRLDELRDSEKSAPEVTVSTKLVVCVIEPSVPLTVMVAGPRATLDPTLTVSVDDALPEDGILIGLVLKVENVTPEGTGPVTDNVTAPEYPSKLEPVIEMEFDAPCAIEIEPGLAFRPKSG